MPERISITVEEGRIKPLVWESRPGGSNWAAILRADGMRDWLRWGEDNASFYIDNLSSGVAVEFGADFITDGPKGGKRGKRIKNRLYGVVRAISRKSVEIDRYESADEAILATNVARSRAEGAGQSSQKLRERLDKLEIQKERIEREIREIEEQLAVDQRLGIGFENVNGPALG